MSNRTIAAIATPAGSGGIGIIKISGPDALPFAQSVFRCPPKRIEQKTQEFCLIEPTDIKSHYFHYGYIIDPQTETVVDEVLFVFMKAPYSYTREDIVEIQAHSGSVTLQTILNLILERGAHLAAPGEFTKRAFLNGRIDLTQAEAVIDIINAKTKKSLELATTLARGELKQEIEIIWDELNLIVTGIEAIVDFPDDIEADVDTEQIKDKLKNEILRPINKLIQQYTDTHFLRDGIKTVIIGRPNVGKSTLMNRLLKKEKSIVTEYPGTTRDIIEDAFFLNSIPLIITDTAGIHSNPDPVEKIGIQKTWQHFEASDLVLLMIDAGVKHDTIGIEIIKKLKTKKFILVINKIDLIDTETYENIPETLETAPAVYISALYDRGIDKLKKMILNEVVSGSIETENIIAPNARQKIALDQCSKKIASSLSGFENKVPVDMVVFDLKDAMKDLGNIIGKTDNTDILETIFSRFCIGK